MKDDIKIMFKTISEFKSLRFSLRNETFILENRNRSRLGRFFVSMNSIKERT